MSDVASQTSQDFGRRLAVEVFRNSRASVIMGALATCIVSYAHIGSVPNASIAFWTAAIMITFIARLALSFVAERRTQSGVAYRSLINLEMLLAANTGLMWSAGLWWLDVGVQDYLFYLRIMVVVGAMAFVVSSLTLYLRVFLAYGFSVMVPSMIFFAERPLADHVFPLFRGADGRGDREQSALTRGGCRPVEGAATVRRDSGRPGFRATGHERTKQIGHYR